MFFFLIWSQFNPFTINQCSDSVTKALFFWYLTDNPVNYFFAAGLIGIEELLDEQVDLFFNIPINADILITQLFN
jgi:hypothetical protein